MFEFCKRFQPSTELHVLIKKNVVRKVSMLPIFQSVKNSVAQSIAVAMVMVE